MWKTTIHCSRATAMPQQGASWLKAHSAVFVSDEMVVPLCWSDELHAVHMWVPLQPAEHTAVSTLSTCQMTSMYSNTLCAVSRKKQVVTASKLLGGWGGL